MKSLTEFIKESCKDKALLDEVYDWLDEISDYITDGQLKNLFAHNNLSRSGWNSNIPFGEDKYPGLIWEDDENTSVLMLWVPSKSTDMFGTFMLLKVENGDPTYRKFSTLETYEFRLPMKGWKQKLSDAIKYFFKNRYSRIKKIGTD